MSVPVSERKEGRFAVIMHAEDLCIYTLQITSNPNVFIPQYERFTIDIENCAKDIYFSIYDANKLNASSKDSLAKRIELQQEAISKCNRLIAAIHLAKRIYHLRDKRIQYWAEKVRDTRVRLLGWNKSDIARLENLP